MKILLLEDDPILSKILAKHLGLLYDVSAVHDGTTALAHHIIIKNKTVTTANKESEFLN